MKYKRILIKLSGESLAGEKKTGIDFDKVLEICSEIKEIAILFRKKINNNNPDTFELIPEDIIFGYYDEDCGMFVTKDALGYPHFFEELEKHVFGFNKPINEYLDKYYKNNISYDEAINLLTKDIKNKRYFSLQFIIISLIIKIYK